MCCKRTWPSSRSYLSIKSNKEVISCFSEYLEMVQFISSRFWCLKYYRVSKSVSWLCAILYYAPSYACLPRDTSPSGLLYLSRRVDEPQGRYGRFRDEKNQMPCTHSNLNDPARVTAIILYNFNIILTSTPRFPTWPLPSCFRNKIQ
jgi:hypothetical protein